MNWKKIWFFIWKDDSFASWLVNVLLAIILVKFVIFPVLGFFLSTSYPVVAVVSCSMEHGVTNCGNGGEKNICGSNNVEINSFDDYWEMCGEWYSDLEINKETFSEFSFKNGFNKGDIMVLVGPKDLKTGDVVVFSSGYGSTPIIHRLVGENEDGNWMTKGDHNEDQMFFEKNIKTEQILGKAVLRVPYLGWVKVIFNDIMGGVLK
jgi:signal peptidase I